MPKHKKHPHHNERKHCVLCGKSVFQFGTDFMIGASGRVVCADCLNTSKKIIEGFPSSQNSPSDSGAKAQTISPKEIIQELNKVIIGQERAKRAIAIALWKQLLRAAGDKSVPRTNLLLYGPTGSGKTALVREAARIVGLPFIDFDATTLSETGYRGRDAQDLVKELLGRYKLHPKLANGVIFLDEVDKLAARGGDVQTEHNRSTQHTLLKLVEGCEINEDGLTISTENLLFIFSGAFTGLARRPQVKRIRPIGFLPSEESAEAETDITVKDFIRFGMEAELMGRVGQYVPIEALNEENLKQILLESDLSLLRKYKIFFSNHGIRLEISDKKITELVQGALARGTGARGLNNLVEEAVEPLLFQLSTGDQKKTMTL